MVAVRLASLLPATRHTWDSVSVGLINNEETLRRLPRKVQAKCQILNHVLFLEPPEAGDVEPRSNVLFFSALESRKGPRLALRALALAPATVALVFAGDGPELGALRKMAVRLGISDRVVFRTGLKRAEALAEVAGTAAVVFTGLREEGGASLAEAMNLGAPVIVLANGGARTVAESCVDSRRVVLIAPTDVAETAQRFAEAMASLTADRLESRDCNLSQEFAMTRLRQAFKTALEVKCR
jgi:glycosyltransferase involved in cell wall biosynthesis